MEIFKCRSNIKGAREEMERNLSARVANAEYYSMNDASLKKLKETQRIVLEAIRHPKVNLESATFLMIVGDKDE